MKILEHKNIDIKNYNSIIYLRIDPEDIYVTIREIISIFSDLSWISKFDEEYIKISFKKRANETARYLKNKIHSGENDLITKDTGEYVVSELAREALVHELNYLDVPLAELFKEQVAGNPGFDFYSANHDNVIIFGEAKYNSKQNAYGVGMEQVSRFIKEEQDLSDLNDIDKFFKNDSLDLAANGEKAYAVAFASKNTPSTKIINGIIKNKYYKDIAKHKEVIYMAVNI